MTTNNFSFSVTAFKAAALPTGRTKSGKLKERAYYYDTRQPGLEACITLNGTISFNAYCWSKTAKKAFRVNLGRLPALSIEAAREMAREKILEISKGFDPIQARRNADPTLGETIDQYLSFLETNERKPRSIENYRYFTRRFLADWTSLTLRAVNREHIARIRSQVRDKDGALAQSKDKGWAKKSDRKTTANRVVRFLSQVFNFAIRDGWNGMNPCRGVQLFPEKIRTRRLEDEELPKFLSACERCRADGDTLVPDALLLCLFSGVRRRNVTGARWEEFDLNAGTWLVPETKNGLPHQVYLAPNILQILMARYEERINEFVFPSSGRHGHLAEPIKGLRRILRLGEIDATGMTIHALKHTFVSYAFEAKIDPITVGRMAGHKISGITARYGHASDKSTREGYLRVAHYMLNAADRGKKILNFPFDRVANVST